MLRRDDFALLNIKPYNLPQRFASQGSPVTLATFTLDGRKIINDRFSAPYRKAEPYVCAQMGGQMAWFNNKDSFLTEVKHPGADFPNVHGIVDEIIRLDVAIDGPYNEGVRFQVLGHNSVIHAGQTQRISYPHVDMLRSNYNTPYENNVVYTVMDDNADLTTAYILGNYRKHELAAYIDRYDEQHNNTPRYTKNDEVKKPILDQDYLEFLTCMKKQGRLWYPQPNSVVRAKLKHAHFGRINISPVPIRRHFMRILVQRHAAVR